MEVNLSCSTVAASAFNSHTPESKILESGFPDAAATHRNTEVTNYLGNPVRNQVDQQYTGF